MPPCAAPGVRARRVELGDDRGLRAGAGLDRRAHAGAAGAHDDDVELVVVDAVDDRRGRRRSLGVHVSPMRRRTRGAGRADAPAGHGSKVKTTRVPRMMRKAAEARAPTPGRAAPCRVRVVVHDRAHAVGAVDQREPEHQHVPPLPERVGELAGDEREVDGRGCLRRPSGSRRGGRRSARRARRPRRACRSSPTSRGWIRASRRGERGCGGIR